MHNKIQLCPLCSKKGLKNRVRLIQINFEEAIWACESEKCIWPIGYKDLIFVPRKVSNTLSCYWENYMAKVPEKIDNETIISLHDKNVLEENSLNEIRKNTKPLLYNNEYNEITSIDFSVTDYTGTKLNSKVNNSTNTSKTNSINSLEYTTISHTNSSNKINEITENGENSSVSCGVNRREESEISNNDSNSTVTIMTMNISELPPIQISYKLPDEQCIESTPKSQSNNETKPITFTTTTTTTTTSTTTTSFETIIANSPASFSVATNMENLSIERIRRRKRILARRQNKSSLQTAVEKTQIVNSGINFATTDTNLIPFKHNEFDVSVKSDIQTQISKKTICETTSNNYVNSICENARLSKPESNIPQTAVITDNSTDNILCNCAKKPRITSDLQLTISSIPETVDSVQCDNNNGILNIDSLLNDFLLNSYQNIPNDAFEDWLKTMEVDEFS